MEAGAVVSLVIGTAVVLPVPALAWSTPLVNLYENACARIALSSRAVAARVALAVTANAVE
jgi:hypothetical protein